MSKSKEKPCSPKAPSEAGKQHACEDAGQRKKDDGRQTTDPPSPERFGGQATDLSSVARDDGLPTDLSAIASATVEAPGAKAGRQSSSQATTVPVKAADHVEKLAKLHDRLLRLQADFDNFRKRTLREKSELFDSANQALMLELLPVLDHLQLGIQAASAQQADKAFREGLAMIFDQLMGVLSKFGLSPIKAENQVFDPNWFEAVNTLPSATEPEGIVVALVRRGYMLRNKLLRPAQVIVSSGPPPEQNAECEI